MEVNPKISLPWRNGPARPTDTAVLVAATRFTFASQGAVILAGPRALRFWAMWPTVPGTIGLSLRFQPRTRAALTLTAWTSPSALAEFLASPAHRAVVSAFRNRLSGTSHRWETEHFDLARCWEQAIDALART